MAVPGARYTDVKTGDRYYADKAGAWRPLVRPRMEYAEGYAPANLVMTSAAWTQMFTVPRIAAKPYDRVAVVRATAWGGITNGTAVALCLATRTNLGGAGWVYLTAAQRVPAWYSGGGVDTAGAIVVPAGKTLDVSVMGQVINAAGVSSKWNVVDAKGQTHARVALYRKGA